MEYRFKIGDEVKVVMAGNGAVGSLDSMPTNTFTIVAQGDYLGSPGYTVDPPIGNNIVGTSDYAYSPFIGELSFELVTSHELKVGDAVIIDDSIETSVSEMTHVHVWRAYPYEICLHSWVFLLVGAKVNPCHLI